MFAPYSERLEHEGGQWCLQFTEDSLKDLYVEFADRANIQAGVAGFREARRLSHVDSQTDRSRES